MPLRRQGRQLDRHELANYEPVVGDLRIEQVMDSRLGRYLRMARVMDVRRPRNPDLMPVLLDPMLIAMTPWRSRCQGSSASVSGTTRRAGWFAPFEDKNGRQNLHYAYMSARKCKKAQQ